VLNLFSVNPLEFHECVLGRPWTKIQSRKSASFYPPTWAIIQLNHTTTAVWHVHVARQLAVFWRQLAADRSLKFASFWSGWGAHAKKVLGAVKGVCSGKSLRTTALSQGCPTGDLRAACGPQSHCVGTWSDIRTTSISLASNINSCVFEILQHERTFDMRSMLCFHSTLSISIMMEETKKQPAVTVFIHSTLDKWICGSTCWCGYWENSPDRFQTATDSMQSG